MKRSKLQDYLLRSPLQKLVSDETRKRLDHLIINLAIIGFLVHLILIAGVHWGIIPPSIDKYKFLDNPISAIYTPFSFILIYEVYLLIYHIPESISVYIGKQYEIVALIIIRRIFKDISNLELQTNWFTHDYNILFLADCLGILVLFFLIFWFRRLYQARPDPPENQKLNRFVRAKQLTSYLLAPVFIGVAIYSLGFWIYEIVQYDAGVIEALSDVNGIFYHEFFTALILVDVLLLIISFRYTEDFNALIRNSGFVISTVLIKLSFSAPGLLNISLLVGAVAFGVVIHGLYAFSVRKLGSGEA